MEPIFEGVTCMDKRAYMHMQYANITMNRSWSWYSKQVIGSLLAVAIVGLLTWKFGIARSILQLTNVYILGLIYVILFVVTFSIMEKRSINLLAEESMKNAREFNKEMHYKMSADMITIKTEYSKSEMKYSVLTNIRETQQYYILFIGKSVCRVLDKQGFLQGEENKFREFIEEKCGLPVKKIHMI